MTLSELRQAVKAGGLVRVSRGWYATAQAAPTVTSAIRAGGRLTCISAAAAHGLWVPEHDRPHLAFRRAVPPVPDVVAHTVRRWSHTSAVAPLDDALRLVVDRHDAELALILLESALNHRLIGLAEAERLAERGCRSKQRILRFLEPTAEAGTETRTRVFLQQHRLPVIAQVQIDGVGRVDLLIGASLVVELDSWAHHSAPRHYAKDRERDLQLTLRGYRVVRLTYHQVMFDWERTSRALLRIARAHADRPLRPC